MFFLLCSKHQKVKSGIGHPKANGRLITFPEDISECLSTQYASVYTKADPNKKIHDPISFFDLSDGNALSLQISTSQKK